jgi:hypothetical protein
LWKMRYYGVNRALAMLKRGYYCNDEFYDL